MSQASTSDAPWSLQGKTAVVTGASRGIGKAIAIHLVRKGVANIAITYASNKAAADDTIEKCRALGVKNAIAIKADALKPEVWPNVIKESLSSLGTETIDILVNNAVLATIEDYKPTTELSVESFSSVMIANVYSPVATTLAFMEHAPKTGGRVINISSVSGRAPNNDPMITYGASKAALDSFTRSFADSFASKRVMTFNSVIVGPTATDAMAAVLSSAPPETKQFFIDQTSAAPRVGEADDIAYIVGFLASEEGRWVNGAAVSANGGFRTVLAALG
ncbi:beta-ketoacyl-acyl carrier protein reductase [Colletotrichum truncatum]|uniref:Beta-ketoacyl-acyl carrier protein reductase n=1 Tax=Colletotrichum truncatum TaxID=5467 RepID=A0ACC3YSN3_COLTU|nr:beta-ketoacyl-acyl carrier protein reductase [Colletotrichum truncatum]KAF6789759.1 beta-ketoacyl-acyl carrier protein reductase [Colletotrichum truncatum]